MRYRIYLAPQIIEAKSLADARRQASLRIAAIDLDKIVFDEAENAIQRVEDLTIEAVEAENKKTAAKLGIEAHGHVGKIQQMKLTSDQDKRFRAVLEYLLKEVFEVDV